MANRPSKPAPTTKKHLARLEREKIQRRYIIIGTAIALAAVFGIILYGVIQQSVLQPGQAILTVNGENVSTRDWQAQTRYARYQLIQNARNTYQLAQIFGSDPNTQFNFTGQLQQIQQQLEPANAGQTTIDRMIDDILIRQEASKRSITVGKDEIEKAFEEAFGYFPGGTPTAKPTFASIPTSTLSPLQLTLMPPTPTPSPVISATATITTQTQATPTLTPPTPTESSVITPTAIPTPEPTPTEFTLEAYQKIYQDTVDTFRNNFQISEDDLRYVIINQIYREKLFDAIVGNPAPTESQVWAHHILVDSEETALDIRNRLANGESFCDLAKEFSTDTSNKDNCGDLGWFSKGKMVQEFEQAAFALEAGQISQPVKTQFGWHIIQSLGKEDRTIPTSDYDQIRQDKFQEWLSAARTDAQVDIKEFWIDRLPEQPTLPQEILNYIQQALQQQPTPPPVVTPQP